MNPGFIQGRTQTIQLPRGGYLSAPIFAGMGPYGAHDPFLSRANPYSQAAAAGPNVFAPTGGVYGTAASYQGAYNDYRNAVDAQNAELRAGFADRFKRNMAEVDKLQGAAVADTNRIYDDREGMVKAQLAKAGLLQGGGTIVSDPLLAVDRERSTSLARTLGDIAQRRIAVDAQLSGDQLRQMEAVTHTPPDMNQLANLSAQAGSGNMDGMQQAQDQIQGGAGGDQFYGPVNHNGFGGPVQQPTVQPSLGMLRNAKKIANKFTAPAPAPVSTPEERRAAQLASPAYQSGRAMAMKKMQARNRGQAPRGNLFAVPPEQVPAAAPTQKRVDQIRSQSAQAQDNMGQRINAAASAPVLPPRASSITAGGNSVAQARAAYNAAFNSADPAKISVARQALHQAQLDASGFRRMGAPQTDAQASAVDAQVRARQGAPTTAQGRADLAGARGLYESQQAELRRKKAAKKAQSDQEYAARSYASVYGSDPANWPEWLQRSQGII